MKNKKVKPKETSTAQKSGTLAIKAIPSELNKPRWSVVSFEKYLAKNLTYNEAIKKSTGSKNKTFRVCVL